MTYNNKKETENMQHRVICAMDVVSMEYWVKRAYRKFSYFAK